MDPDACMKRALDAYDESDGEELVAALADYSAWLAGGGFAGEEAPDIAEALYWLCAENHEGQWSDLYAALSCNPFTPGPISNGPEPGSYADMLYRERAA